MENSNSPSDYSNIKSIQEKKLRLKQRFSLSNEYISVEDISSALEVLSLSDKDAKEKAQNIFNLIDTDKKGTIRTEEFIENLSASLNDSGELKEFKIYLQQINKHLISKSQLMMSRLKKIKKKAWANDDQETLDDLEWVIDALTEKDIYRLQLDEVNRLSENENKGDGPTLDYLVKYSMMEDAKRVEDDIKTIRNRDSRVNFTIPNSPRSPRSSNMDQMRETLKISSFLSPSIFAKLNTHLGKIGTFDFNIFELNELVDKKATFYVAYDIFSRCDLFNKAMVDENNFKSFVYKILEGYERDMPYHNDLHAGDVMQTTYMIMELGDVKEVSVICVC